MAKAMHDNLASQKSSCDLFAPLEEMEEQIV
jgi:hypothetical protein